MRITSRQNASHKIGIYKSLWHYLPLPDYHRYSGLSNVNISSSLTSNCNWSIRICGSIKMKNAVFTYRQRYQYNRNQLNLLFHMYARYTSTPHRAYIAFAHDIHEHCFGFRAQIFLWNGKQLRQLGLYSRILSMSAIHCIWDG